MRKISMDSAKALINGRSFKRDNTTVIDGVLRLYNNPIAWIEKGVLTLTDAGWDTVTTKDRLNGVLSVFNTGLGIIQRNFEWYIVDDNSNTTPFINGMEVEL